jgi:large subunit ribosomal protein L18
LNKFNSVWKRRKQLKTDYRKRLILLKGKTPRLVIRLSNNFINLQYIVHNSKGDISKLNILSKSLREIGWKKTLRSLPVCYLTGYLFGVKAKEKKLDLEMIVDLGMQSAFPKGRLFAAIKGAVDAGVKLKVEEKMFPSEDRIKGKHIKLEKEFETILSKIKK